MIRKSVYILAIAVVATALLVSACSGGKYADVKKVLGEYIAANEDLAKGLDSADDARKVAALLKTYVTKMKELSPKVESLPDKYPELKDNPPEELKSMIDTMEKSASSFRNILDKIGKYMGDEEVVKVLEEFENF